MKAEHRKELQTNSLATFLGKLVNGAAGTSNRIWYIVTAIILLGIAWWWWSGRTQSNLSTAWINYQLERRTVDGARQAIESAKGTSAEWAARLNLADMLFKDGYKDFFIIPERAKEKFQEAAEVFGNVAQSGGTADLKVRALLGQARCHEWLGNIDDAKKQYQLVQSRYGNHPLVAEAKDQLEKLEEGADLAFYKDWPNRLPTMTAKPGEEEATSEEPEEKPEAEGQPKE